MHHAGVNTHVIRQCQQQAMPTLASAVMQVSRLSSPTMQREVNAMRPPLQAAVEKDLPWLKDLNLSAWVGTRPVNKSAAAVPLELQKDQKVIRLRVHPP